jgi:hypothetical protein
MSSTERRVVSEMVVEVVNQVEAEFDAFAGEMEDCVLAQIQPDSGFSEELMEAMRRGIRAALRDALARLRTQAELPRELPPEIIEVVRLQASARHDPRQFVDGWLVGQEVFWSRFALVAEQTLGDPAQAWEVVKATRLQLSGYAASLSRLFRSAWEDEVASAEGIDDTRLQAVSRVLDGYWIDTADLDYDLSHQHVAVVADSPGAVEELARHTERQALVVPAPEGGVWGWLGGSSPISDDDLDAAIDRQRSPEEGVVAVGEPAAGVAGFSASHQEALEARDIAAATGERVVRFAHVRLLAAVLRDGELAKDFVQRELGELDRPSEHTHELRATLRAYLEHSQSIAATAALRRRDRKTIVRQLRAAERLIDHTVSDRSDELLLALRLAEILNRRA